MRMNSYLTEITLKMKSINTWKYVGVWYLIKYHGDVTETCISDRFFVCVFAITSMNYLPFFLIHLHICRCVPYIYIILKAYHFRLCCLLCRRYVMTIHTHNAKTECLPQGEIKGLFIGYWPDSYVYHICGFRTALVTLLSSSKVKVNIIYTI